VEFKNSFSHKIFKIFRVEKNIIFISQKNRKMSFFELKTFLSLRFSTRKEKLKFFNFQETK